MVRVVYARNRTLGVVVVLVMKRRELPGPSVATSFDGVANAFVVEDRGDVAPDLVHQELHSSAFIRVLEVFVGVRHLVDPGE